ncbi:MAG: hypothetical protein VX313_04115 [Bacteroidota bacterium]|nr:hypothetical protein [Bacteroidota bacterium]
MTAIKRKTTRADTLARVSDYVAIMRKQYPDNEKIQKLDSEKLARLNEAQLHGFNAIVEIALEV